MEINENVAVPFEYISERVLKFLERMTPIFARTGRYGELTDPCVRSIVIRLEIGTVYMSPIAAAHEYTPCTNARKT